MRQLSLLELAKQGDPDAIAALMNRVLQPRGVTAKSVLQDGCLHILLEAEQVPHQSTLVEYVCQGVMGLGVKSIESVAVYGRQIGEVDPAWTRVIELGSEVALSSSDVEVLTPVAAAATGAAAAGAMQSASAQTNEFKSVAWQGRLAKFLLWGLIAGIIAFLFYLFVTRFFQQRKFELSQTLVAGAAEVEDATDINALENSQKRLQEAENILQQIPNLPGSDRRKIEAEMAAIRPRLEAVNQQLEVEKMALRNLESAKRLGSEAAQLAQNQLGSVANWQQAHTKWKQAISLLEAIPEKGTFVSKQAKERLGIYRQNYFAISQRLRTTETQQQQRKPNSVFTQDPEDLIWQK